MEDNKSFEEYLKELEEILAKLENREISLDEAVKGYTMGLELSKKCYMKLEANEKLVVEKMTEAGLVDFKTENN